MQGKTHDLARLLKVDGIVEGSVSREGDRVRVTAKLVDGRTDLNLWSNSYRRDIGEVLGFQEEVAETITRAIGGQVSRNGRPAVAVRLKPEALDSYLKARKLASVCGARGRIFAARGLRPGAGRRGVPENATPSNATGQQRYGLALMRTGRFEEALERIRMAQQLDPLSPMMYGNEGELLMLWRRYDEAIQFFRTAQERKLDFFGTRVISAAAYLGKGMYDPAISELRTARRMGGGPIVNARLAHVYAVSGRRREAAAILADLLDPRKTPHVSDYGIAVAYAGLGDTDRAMARLMNEFHARSRTMVYLGQDPYLDPIRKDPRFRDLVRRVGLFE